MFQNRPLFNVDFEVRGARQPGFRQPCRIQPILADRLGDPGIDKLTRRPHYRPTSNERHAELHALFFGKANDGDIATLLSYRDSHDDSENPVISSGIGNGVKMRPNNQPPRPWAAQPANVAHGVDRHLQAHLAHPAAHQFMHMTHRRREKRSRDAAWFLGALCEFQAPRHHQFSFRGKSSRHTGTPAKAHGNRHARRKHRTALSLDRGRAATPALRPRRESNPPR